MDQNISIAEKNTNTTSKNEVKPMISYFYKWEKAIPNRVFLRQPKNGKWTEYTWHQTGDQVRRMATALQSLVPKGSNIGIVSKNTAHWIMSDLAIMMSGNVSVPFYPTLQANQLREVLTHSGCKVLFVGKLDDWESMKDGIPEDVTVITYPESPAEGIGNFLKWDTLIAQHAAMKEDFTPNLDDLYTIIYTSGTTGTPKGVMHTFYTGAVTLEMASSILKVNSNDDKFFSYLPLCHIAERAIVESASLYAGGSISFVESLDTFAANLAEVEPTHFLAVPRIWTRFQLGILSKLPQKKLDTYLKIPIFSGMVKNKIKKGLGLSKAKILLTGAAPMPSSLIEWFKKLGIVIQEAYGMTENGGCCTLMPKDKMKMGTVGRLYPGAQVKIDAETGEVCMKSEWVMTGYYKDPEKTGEVLIDGWLHTGDMGELDNEGFLKITGRVKDTFKTAKAEYIVPAPIEFGFAQNNNIEQVCVVGRSLPQPVALVVLSELGKALSKEEVNKSLEATLKELNPTLINYERIQKIIISKEPWTVENNLLTPTLKIKRNVVEEVYGKNLEKWYEMKEVVIWE